MECGQEVRKGVGAVVSAEVVRAPVADVDGDTMTCQVPRTPLQTPARVRLKEFMNEANV